MRQRKKVNYNIPIKLYGVAPVVGVSIWPQVAGGENSPSIYLSSVILRVTLPRYVWCSTAQNFLERCHHTTIILKIISTVTYCISTVSLLLMSFSLYIFSQSHDWIVMATFFYRIIKIKLIFYQWVTCTVYRNKYMNTFPWKNLNGIIISFAYIAIFIYSI